MKNYISLFALSALLAGCTSYTEIGRPLNGMKTDDGDTPIASVTVFNVAYSLFGILPISSGEVWKDGPYAERPVWNVVWFEDKATLDENLASVRAALREVGSSRIDNLVTESDSWRLWSFLIIKRKVMKSTCTVLR